MLRDGCRRVLFSDLVVDDNRTGLADPDEQSHGIEVEAGTEDLVIDRCVLRECFGDGVRMVGVAGANVKGVRIQNSLLQRNKRSGLGVQRALERVIVAGCVFDDTITDQSIDFEPSGHDGPSELIIQGCIVRHTNRGPAITITGISGPEPAVRVKLTDNVVLGGQVFCTDVDQLAIQGNVVVVTELGASNRIPVQVQRGGDSVLITGNRDPRCRQRAAPRRRPLGDRQLGARCPNRRALPRAELPDHACVRAQPRECRGRDAPLRPGQPAGGRRRGGRRHRPGRWRAGLGRGRSLAGTGDPDNRVAGNDGDLFQRLDGSGPALYVKESGDGTTTGWNAK